MSNYFFLSLAGLCLATSSFNAMSAQPPSRIVWEFSSGAPVWSPLTLRDNTLYFGNDNGDFFSFDTQIRKPKWRFHSKGKIRSGLAFYRNNILFASDDGYLYMLRQNDGRLMWKFNLNDSTISRLLPAPEGTDYDYLKSSPIIDQDTLYIGSGDGHLYAIDLATRQLHWQFASAAKIRATPTIVKDQVCIGSWDHHFYCVDRATGKERWRYDSKNIIQATALFIDGKLIFGGRTPALFALNAYDGKEIWRSQYADGSWVESTAIADGDRLIVGSSDSFKLSAFDIHTGKEIWKLKTGGWSWMTPILDRGVVYIGAISAAPYYVPNITLEAGLFAVRASDGQLIWKHEPTNTTQNQYLKAGYFARPVVDANTLYVADIQGKIQALRK